MLEAKDCKELHEFGPFLGAIVDSMCAERSQVPVTDVFMRYKNLVLTLLRDRHPFEWTSQSIADISRDIHEFREVA